MSLQGPLLKAGSPGKCSQCCFLFSCLCRAVVACIQLILAHLEILAGFIARSSEVIETFKPLPVFVPYTVFEGERSLPTCITSFLVV